MAKFFRTDQRYVLQEDYDVLAADFATLQSDHAALQSDYDAHIALLGAAWTSDTTAVTASSGTITSASCSRRYKKIGRQVHLMVHVTITTVGTGANACIVSLPHPAAAIAIGAGREVAANGSAVTGTVFVDPVNTLHLYFYNNSTIIQAGFQSVVSVIYEATS